MSAPQIKGWCPGALRPMASGDGLVVRVRPPLGKLNAVQAHGLGEAAQRLGNGVLEMTTRANLQIRGVANANLPELHAQLRDLDLLDASPELEAKRNIILNPFRTPQDLHHEAIAIALTKGLSASDLPPLPGKFGFLIDVSPGYRHLSGISADIRIESSGDGLIVRADGPDTGRLSSSVTDAVEAALKMARWFVTSGGIGADGRGRMRNHLANGVKLAADLVGDARANPAAPKAKPGPNPFGVCAAAAFGQLPAERLGWLANHAPDGLLQTPFRMILARGAIELPDVPDLITDPDAALMRVYACTGAPGCPQGLSQTRDLAAQLADRLPTDTTTLHVSGCAKGCAHPAPTDLTLTATGPGQFDLIQNGRAGDASARTGLSVAQVSDALELLNKEGH